MSAQRVLFIGGTGTISASCVADALAKGHDVTVLNRGSGRRALPEGVRELVADARDPEALRAAIGDAEFDVVAQFLAFTPDHVASDVDLFQGRTGQYIFISSASAYDKPPRRVPVSESTPLRNPFWQYSRDKIAGEDLLIGAYRDAGFPVTIVRPSHTYDRGLLPTMGHWTDIARMRAGKPVVVHGDGTSLWTLTHAKDFAVGFTGLLGHPEAIGEAYTITGDHAPSWNQIYTWLAAAAGVDDPEFVHIASETIAAFRPEAGPGLLGDKSHTALFDNSKIKALVPGFGTTIRYDEGAREAIEHHDATPELQQIDAEQDAAFDRMVAHARSAG